jgi:hypothetical protein
MRGRKPPGPEFVARLQGGAAAKQRLEAILQTVAQQLGVNAASARLGLTPQRFHMLRQQALQAALDALAARPGGRPRQTVTAEQEQIDALQQKLEQLRRELATSQLREQLAVLLPGRSGPGEKKRAAGRGGRRCPGR